MRRSCSPSCRVAVTALMTLAVLAPDGAAQTSATAFTGRWQRLWSAGVRPPRAAPTTSGATPMAAPTLLLTITATDRLLSVEERFAEGQPARSVRTYRVDPAWTADSLASRGGRAFRWLAADRLEVRDALQHPGVEDVAAITEVWTLDPSGFVLRIQRRQRTPGPAGEMRTQGLVYQRVGP